MNPIDKFLNNITMYRLLYYGLIVITAATFVFSAIGFTGFSILLLAGSLAVLVNVSYAAHLIMVYVFRSAPSKESWVITALILFLILKPAANTQEFAVLALAAFLGVVGKYVLTYANRHLFNPVVVALIILQFLGSSEVLWWVGAKYLLPVVLIVGLLVVRKIRRFDLFFVFWIVALAAQILTRGITMETLNYIPTFILSGPLVFFSTIMMTEPQTAPPERKQRLIFSAIIALLCVLPYNIAGILYPSPQVALFVGNLFTFAFSTRRRIRLELISITDLGADIYEFLFYPDHEFSFKPGQYLEYTLPHKYPDNRGNRRYMTIASSPTEKQVRLVTKIDTKRSSSFKKALMKMQPGDEIWASQLSGDLTLPKDKSRGLVFIAGGVGITPFSSMVRNMVDTKDQRDAILYYLSASPEGFGYWELFNQATANGLVPNYVLTGDKVPEGWTGKTGRLSEELIRGEVPDYKRRTYYLSGPNAMVNGYIKVLRKAGVPRSNIRTDYFPGF